MRYSFESRCRAVQAIVAGGPVGKVATAQGVSRATAYRWWRRYQAGGWPELHDHACTPRRLPPELEARILRPVRRAAVMVR